MDEFVDSYSDDLIYIQSIETSYQEKSLGFSVVDQLFEGFLARIYAVMMIGSIEGMIESWHKNYDPDRVLEAYLQRGSNRERVAALTKALERHGVDSDREVLENYLAIKYIRNTIAHSKWKDHEKEFVESRDFPGDVMKLNCGHIARMKEVNQQMMLYLAFTSKLSLGDA